MVKIILDDNNLSKMHPLSKIGTDRRCERTSTSVTEEAIKIKLYDGFPSLRTNTGQDNNEMNTCGSRNEID